MLGDEDLVDKLKLYLIVREKGGYESVSKNGIWELVAEEMGLSCGLGCSLKLTYVKNLDILEKYFQGLVQSGNSKNHVIDTGMNRDSPLMNLDPQLRGNGYPLDSNSENGDLKCTGGGDICSKNEIDSSQEYDKSVKPHETNFEMSSDTSLCLIDWKKKREHDQTMLSWVIEVAKDPRNLGPEPLPERSKWKLYGTEQIWKQVIMAREYLFLKRNGDQSNAIWMAKKKMHPSMYDDYDGSQSLRSSQRILQAKESLSLGPKDFVPRACFDFDSLSGTQSDSEDYFNKEFNPFSVDSVLYLSGKKHKSVRVGHLYQANVPEFIEETYNYDDKWLGSRVWSPKSKENNECHRSKRTRSGERIQELCKCRNSGSVECVRVHTEMKTKRLKFELGSAFSYWKFDQMGEQVSRLWTKEEEKKFQSIVDSNPPSLGKCFWDEMFKAYPGKSREALVSYYFNVFVLKRRAEQNRSIERDIDSDGDEAEFGPMSNGFGHVVNNSPDSIFHSPKKSYLKVP